MLAMRSIGFLMESAPSRNKDRMVEMRVGHGGQRRCQVKAVRGLAVRFGPGVKGGSGWVRLVAL